MLRKVILIIMVVFLISLIGIISVNANEIFLEKFKTAGIKADGTPLKVGICAAGLTAEFAQVLNGYAAWLLEQAGCEVDYVDASWDLNRQIGFFEDFATMGKDVVVCQGVDIYALTSAVRSTQAKGITVIATNNPMLDKDDNLVADFCVHTPDRDMGKAGADIMGEKAAGKKVKVVQIMGNLANMNARERSEYFQKGLEKYPNIELVDSVEAEWFSDKAYDLLSDLLTATPDIWGVFIHSDGMLPGVWAALKQANKLYPVGDEKHVFLVSINGDPVGLKGIREGVQDVIIEHSAYGHAIISAKAALMVAKGIDYPESPGNNIQTTTSIVTIENVDDPSLWGNFGIPHDVLWPGTQELFEFYKWPGDEKIFE